MLDDPKRMGSPKNEAPLVSQLKSRQSAKIGEIAHDGSSFVTSAQCRDAKARQTAKIREIGDALRLAGYVALDEQAVVLGLSRSTTWSILQAPHKASGLTGAVINRMLAGPELPAAVRKIILEYVNEKVVGLYGHSATGRRRFSANLSGQAPPSQRLIKHSSA
jgi:hypothetical protein